MVIMLGGGCKKFEIKHKSSDPSKLCACARAHGFQRLRTRVNILLTDTQYHDEAMF